MLRNKFILMTSNISLKYIFTQPYLKTRQAILLAFLREFYMEIKCIKGNQTRIDDVLSRHPHQTLTYTGSSVRFDVEEKIQEVLLQDLQYLILQEELQQVEITGYTINQQGLIS